MNDVLLACFQWLKERAHPVNKTGDPQGDKRIRYSVPELPEVHNKKADIQRLILLIK